MLKSKWVSCLLSIVAYCTVASADWPQWRGPDANGSSRTAKPPIRWSETENVRWKVPIPGLGNSTPIVWKGRIYVTTAIATDRIDESFIKPEDQPERPFGIVFPHQLHKFDVIALDRPSGRRIWQKTCTELVPHEGHHPDNSFASPSIATDGKRLYVWFGSPGLFCLDLHGNQLWQKNFGEVPTRLSFGEAASPVILNETLLVIRDNEEQSYLLALNAATGDIKWRQDRDEPSAWATPFVVNYAGRTQVITNASNRVRSYDFDDGSLIWECGGQVSNVTPSPVVAEDLVICMSGYRGSSLLALPLNAKGDITDSDKIAWKMSKGTPYIPSPVLYDGVAYFNQSNQGIVSAVKATNGEVLVSRTRLPHAGSMYASPVAADGRVYFTYRDGRTFVVEHGTKLKVIATNKLDDSIDASLAIVGKELYIRGKNNLYCIVEAR